MDERPHAGLRELFQSSPVPPGTTSAEPAGSPPASRPKRKRRTLAEQIASIDEQIAKLHELRKTKTAQLAEETKARQARERERQRKLRDRRLYILGGEVVRQANEGRQSAIEVIEIACGRLLPGHQAPFDGWSYSDDCPRGGVDGVADGEPDDEC